MNSRLQCKTSKQICDAFAFWGQWRTAQNLKLTITSTFIAIDCRSKVVKKHRKFKQIQVSIGKLNAVSWNFVAIKGARSSEKRLEYKLVMGELLSQVPPQEVV